MSDYAFNPITGRIDRVGEGGGEGFPIKRLVTNLGGPVEATDNGEVFLDQSTNTFTDGTVANVVNINLQGTENELFVGRGTEIPAATIQAGTTGTLLNGITGDDPIFQDFTLGNYSFVSNTAGETRILRIANSDNTSSSSGAALTLEVGGSSAGNPRVNFNVPGGQSYSLGARNTVSGYFELHSALDMGGNTLFQARPDSQIYTFGYAKNDNDVSLIASNTGTTNAGAFVRAGIGTSSTGDAWLSIFRGSNISYAFGMDVSDNHILKITTSLAEPTPSSGTVLSTLTSSGIQNLPLQPCFQARLQTNVTNVTGDGTNYPMVFDTEVFDQSGAFNGSTTYTAQRSGKHRFSFTFRLLGISGHTGGAASIITTGKQYSISFNPGAGATANATFSQTMTILTDMVAGDTCSASVLVSGGTKTIGITGVSGGQIFTHFSGELDV